jgi:phage shock protein PspC (stress-responsive transcriptional regulator)
VLNFGDVIVAGICFKFSINKDDIFVDTSNIIIGGLKGVCAGVFESFLADVKLVIVIIMRLQGISLVDL